MARSLRTLPASPFVTWLHERVAKLAANHDAPQAVLAAELGHSERWLYRYLNQIDSEGRPTDEFDRAAVEDALDRVAVDLTDLYPDLADEGGMNERYCAHCRDTVTTSDDLICPWCEHETEAVGERRRQWCERCDRMLFPARDGTCWRCGTVTQRHPPWDECGCGCGETFARFDRHGRRRRWVLGHAPKAEIRGRLDLEPFARYLEQQLADLDPIEALASKHQLSRDDVLGILERRDDELPRAMISKALWHAGRVGQGKGMPQRPGSLTLFDLYPDDQRSRRCPDCGGGKSPAATRCKQCSLDHARAQKRQAVSEVLARDELILEAHRIHVQRNVSVREVARELLDRTPYSSAESFAAALRREFRRRDLPYQTGLPISAELLGVAHRLHERGGMTVTEVAEHLIGRSAHPSVSSLRTALYRRFKEEGLTTYHGPRPVPAALSEQAFRLQQDGATIADAATAVGVHERSLRADWAKRGWKARRGPRRQRSQTPMEAGVG